MSRTYVGQAKNELIKFVAGVYDLYPAPNLMSFSFTGIIPAGIACIMSGSGVKQADGTGSPVFAGVSVASQETVLDSNDGSWNPEYDNNGITLLTDGFIIVRLNTGVTPDVNNTVYFIPSTGLFTNVSTSNIAVNGKFSSLPQNDLIKIRLGVN